MDKKDIEEMKESKLQDYEFLTVKKQENLKKFERMNSNFHLTEFKGKHTIFVDNDDDIENFNAAEHFNTEPELVSRVFNRIPKEKLKENTFTGSIKIKDIQKIKKLQSKTKTEINDYNLKSNEIGKIIGQVEIQRNLMKKGKHFPETEAEDGKLPIYKWKKQRAK